MKKAPTIIKKTTGIPVIGQHGQRFHAPRHTAAFTSDPPGFTTEKDPRGKADNKWFNLPPATGIPPYRLKLSSILSNDAIDKINQTGRLVFHTLGDSGGVNTTTYQERVADYMELDFNAEATDGSNPSFFYHLGDVVYYDGEIANYYWEFYEPYLHYPAPIFAIPGNHDGDVDPNDEYNEPSDSLKGFVQNFCAQAAVHLPEAKDAPRLAMTQPNVYWTLQAPLLTLIGLYSNVPEGGKLSQSQLDWFEEELAAAPKNQALILAVHHPLYSAYGHEPGSQYLKSVIENAAKVAKRTPDLILTGHVHNYQRFTGVLNGKSVPCIVAGAGGYNQRLHRLSRAQFDPDSCPYKFQDGPEVLEKFNDSQHGYLRIEVTAKKIICKYIAVDDPVSNDVPSVPAKPFDTFEISF